MNTQYTFKLENQKLIIRSIPLEMEVLRLSNSENTKLFYFENLFLSHADLTILSKNMCSKYIHILYEIQ